MKPHGQHPPSPTRDRTRRAKRRIRRPTPEDDLHRAMELLHGGLPLSPVVERAVVAVHLAASEEVEPRERGFTLQR